MTTPYEGIRVVEIADDPAGEMLGHQLAHLGAEVVKIEPPGGVRSRHLGPTAAGHGDTDHGDTDHRDTDHRLGHWYYNGGKASVVLDLFDDADRAAAMRLLDDADVCISTLHPLVLDALGLDWHDVTASRPRLIVVSATPFALDGPWARRVSSDLVALAASGLLITSGYDDHSIPPIRPGGDQAFHTTASFGHIATALALIQRQVSGQGAVIDLSMHESAGLTVELANPYWFYPRGLVQRQTCRHAQPVPTAPAHFRCGDDRYIYFALILADPKPWKALVEWMDECGVAADLVEPEFDDLGHRQRNFGHVQELVEVHFLLMDAQTAYHGGQARGLPIGIINAPEDLLRDEHLAERGYFVAVDEPDVAGVLHPGAPYRFSALDTAPLGPAARLGADTERFRDGWPGSGSPA